jgi:hypothetical protein
MKRGHTDNRLYGFRYYAYKINHAGNIQRASPSLHEIIPQHNHMTTRKVNVDEDRDPTSLTCCPTMLHDDILTAQLRPHARKPPDFIRLLEPRLIGHSTSWRRYSSIREIQIGQLKHCNDSNLTNTYQFVMKKYTHSQIMDFAHIGPARCSKSSRCQWATKAPPTPSPTPLSLP